MTNKSQPIVMLRKVYLRIVPASVRDWIYRRRHPDSRWEHIFARQRSGIHAYIRRAAAEQWFQGTVLEIGSGRETFTHGVFQELCPQIRLLRSELSPGGYGQHATNGSGAFALYCDVTALGVRNASLDGIICSEVLEHVYDYRAALDEITRVLRPGGKLLITCPFLFPLHGPQDYWRFTPQAFELLLHAHFRIVDLNLIPVEKGAMRCPVIIGLYAERK